MTRVQLRVDGAAGDDALAALSAAFPEATFDVLAAVLDDETIVDIIEVATSDGPGFVAHLEATSSIELADVIALEEERVLVELRVPVSETYSAIVDAGVVPQQPVTLRDGWYHNTVTASHEQLSVYVRRLASLDIPYEIITIGQSVASDDVLTERQLEFVSAAVERGFYGSPRTCTLTELADVLGISLSAVSRLRHRVEGRVMQAYLDAATADS